MDWCSRCSPRLKHDHGFDFQGTHKHLECSVLDFAFERAHGQQIVNMIFETCWVLCKLSATSLGFGSQGYSLSIKIQNAIKKDIYVYFVVEILH